MATLTFQEALEPFRRETEQILALKHQTKSEYLTAIYRVVTSHSFDYAYHSVIWKSECYLMTHYKTEFFSVAKNATVNLTL